MILLDLILNIALLVALAAATQVIEARRQLRRLESQFLQGLLFGAVGVVGMMTPVHFQPGIIFDGRSIILSVGGLFGGPVVALIAALICGAYRLWLGGAGAAMGLSVIIASAALGVAFHYWRRAARPLGWLQLWGFGLLVHGIMLGLVILLPAGARQAAWHQLGLAIIGFYPVATTLICLLFLDYEKQRHARAALEESEGRFRGLIEQATDGILLADARTKRFVFANRQMQRLLGYPESELLRLTLADIHPAADLPAVLVQFERQARGEITLAGKIPVQRKDGTVFYADVNSTAIHLQGRDCVMGIFREITEHQRAEAALRESERRSTKAQEMAHLGSWELDLATNKLTWSDEVYRIFGLAPQAFAGTYQAFFEAVHPDDRGAVEAAYQESLRAGRDTYEIEHRIVRKGTGEIRQVLEKCEHFRDSSGRVIRSVGMVHDITERKRAEEALGQRAEELAALNALGQAVNATLALGETAKAALAGMLQAVRADLAFLFLRDGERLILEDVLPSVARQRLGDIPEHRVGECICGLAVREKKPLYSRDIFHDLRCTWDECKRAGIRSFAALPLTSGDEIIGVIGLASDAERDFERQARFLETLASQIAIALVNARLYERVQRELDQRQRAEAVSRERETHLRLALDAARMGTWDWDLGTGRITWSLGHEALWGYAPGSFPGTYEGYESRLHPDDVEDARRAGQRALDEHSIYEHEYRIRQPDGAVRWIASRGQAFFGPDDRPTRMIGVAMDITERKRAEDELRRNEARFRSLANVLQYRGATTQEFLDFALEEAIKLTASKIGYIYFYQEDRQQFVLNTWSRDVMKECRIADPETCYELARTGLWGEAVRQRRPILLNDFQAEHPLKKGYPEGHAPLLKYLTVPIFSGDKIVAVTAVANKERDYDDTDIEQLRLLMDAIWKVVEQRTAEEALRKSEERFRKQAALLDAANDAIYVRALDGAIKYWNEGAGRLYGWSRTEALGKKITDLGLVDPAVLEAAQATLLKEGHWSGDLKRAGKDGKERMAFCRWTLLRNEQGQPTEVLAINTDITEQKQLEAQFLRAQRMEGIGSLAGGIAHDLNNILTPILMSVPLLRDTAGDSEDREMLDTVQACAQRGADIIRQLLTFARGQPGARLPLPMRHLLREMEAIIRETFPRNIRLVVTVREGLWSVLGDATQIHQALMNLCVNARDAMPNGGTLTLAAENRGIDEAFAARAPDARPGDYVCVSVRDTGVGIPAEHLERIFDPFFTTKEVGKGTGLGLPTVLGIARGHGGFVRVDSQVGRGTGFEVFLPASPAAKAGDRNEPESPTVQGHGELVLLVDDEATVREVAQRALETHGYRVLVAAEGAEALAVFARNRSEIRVVVTDMMMPGMDGSALVRALRQSEPSLPILIMTGLTEKAGLQGMEGLVLMEVLPKPFSVKTLLSTLHQVLTAGTPDSAPGK